MSPHTRCRLDPHKRYSTTDDSMSSRHVVQASKRPTSMAVPLPSWVSDRDESILTASSQSIAVSIIITGPALYNENLYNRPKYYPEFEVSSN